MRIVLFCHSLLSDWNHGNAHFLRGIVGELKRRGHDVRVFEPHDAWSMVNLLEDAGDQALTAFNDVYPHLSSTRFDPERFDLDAALDDADLVLVHEWNSHPIVARIGRHCVSSRRYVLLFHDTHHRSVSDPAAMGAYDLHHYDGVLAFGEVVRQQYLARGWARRVWTWHEAADTRVFRPHPEQPQTGDVVWIGNWGDGERSDEIRQFLIAPSRELGLRTTVHGVRYPQAAREELQRAGVRYAGWLPNAYAPRTFAQFRATVHIPRRPYVEALPGVPTIRVFEALACGIPLISCWWDDREGLFRPGRDFLMVRTADEMKRSVRDVLEDRGLADELSARGRRTIRSQHTCSHRVDELLAILAEIRQRTAAEGIPA